MAGSVTYFLECATQSLYPLITPEKGLQNIRESENKAKTMKFTGIGIERYISLCVGILGLAVCGIIKGFNIYAVALKRTFNYTQTELEYIAVSGIAGLETTSYFSGIVIDKFGPRSACIIGGILSCSCFVLIWVSTKFIAFFTSRSWLYCSMYFLAACGCCFNYMASMGTISLNFKGKHQGKIVGFACAITGVSPLLFAMAYHVFFVQGHITDEQNQNLAGFFVLISISLACSNILGAVFLKIVPPVGTYAPLKGEQGDSSVTKFEDTSATTKDISSDLNIDVTRKLTLSGESIVTKAKDNMILNDKTPIIQKDPDCNTNRSDDCKLTIDISCFQMIKTPRFHYMVWIVLLIKGIGLTFAANITIIAKSANLESASPVLLMVIPIANTLARFLGGMIPDVLKQKLPFIPISSLLVFVSFVTVLSQVFLIFYNQSFVGLVCCYLMASISTGVVSVMTPIIILELFGTEDFSQKFGLVLTLVGIAAFPFAKLFGAIYEHNTTPGSNDCYGVHCSRWSYIINAILACISTLLSIGLMKAEHHQKAKN